MTPDRVTRLLAKAEAYGWTPDPRLREYTAWLIAQTEAELADESAPTHPHNAIIRQAKRIIEVLNVPEGGGVAWDSHHWRWFSSKPRSLRQIFVVEGQDYGSLPDTALPPLPDDWPRGWANSWITASTEEFK